MRILQISNSSTPTPTPASVPAPDLGRVEAVERIAKSILQRIQDIEERIKALEQPQKTVESSPTPITVPPEPTSSISLAEITMDTDTLKKDLFAKMWKYLNDKAAA